MQVQPSVSAVNNDVQLPTSQPIVCTVPKCVSDSVDALPVEAAGNASTSSEYSARDHKSECGNFANTVRNNIANCKRI